MPPPRRSLQPSSPGDMSFSLTLSPSGRPRHATQRNATQRDEPKAAAVGAQLLTASVLGFSKTNPTFPSSSDRHSSPATSYTWSNSGRALENRPRSLSPPILATKKIGYPSAFSPSPPTTRYGLPGCSCISRLPTSTMRDQRKPALVSCW